MLRPPPIEFRCRSGRIKYDVQSAPPAPVALTLVGASYVGATSVTLEFDRPINIEAINGTQIVVDDPQIFGERYEATGAATLLDPTTVRIGLTSAGESTGGPITLTATANSGIVASDDGGTWAGVTDLELPFGS